MVQPLSKKLYGHLDDRKRHFRNSFHHCAALYLGIKEKVGPIKNFDAIVKTRGCNTKERFLNQVVYTFLKEAIGGVCKGDVLRIQSGSLSAMISLQKFYPRFLPIYMDVPYMEDYDLSKADGFYLPEITNAQHVIAKKKQTQHTTHFINIPRDMLQELILRVNRRGLVLRETTINTYMPAVLEAYPEIPEKQLKLIVHLTLKRLIFANVFKKLNQMVENRGTGSFLFIARKANSPFPSAKMLEKSIFMKNVFLKKPMGFYWNGVIYVAVNGTRYLKIRRYPEMIRNHKYRVEVPEEIVSKIDIKNGRVFHPFRWEGTYVSQWRQPSIFYILTDNDEEILSQQFQRRFEHRPFLFEFNSRNVPRRAERDPDYPQWKRVYLANIFREQHELRIERKLQRNRERLL